MAQSVREFKKGDVVWSSTIKNGLPVLLEAFLIDEERVHMDDVVVAKNLTKNEVCFLHPDTTCYKTKQEAFDDAAQEIHDEMDKLHNAMLKLRSQM